MRIRHSLKAIIPVILLLASTRTVQAQGGPPMQGMPMPGSPMAGPQQVPGSYGMYPYQSPYQGMFEQTYQRDGTWFKNSVNGFGPNNRPRDWFMTLDYTRTLNPKMKGLVGAEGVPTYFQQNAEAIDDDAGLLSYNYFDAAHANIIPKLSTNGLKLSGGFWNPDDSGFLFSGGFQFENESIFNARAAALGGRFDTATALQFELDSGRSFPRAFSLGGQTDLHVVLNDILAPGTVFDTTGLVPHGVLGTTAEILDRTLLNLYSIPTYNGNTSGVGVNGESAPYDIQFLLKQSIATGGVNADWAFSPVYDNDRIKIRSLVGGRWFWINETFDFEGISTLLARDDDFAKVFPPDTGVAPTTTTVGDYDVAVIGATDLVVYSYIRSQVVTNLYGPEIGLHYELGKRRGIRLSGGTRIAAMFNSETLRLSGDNIGNFMGTELAVADPITGATTESNMYDTSTRQGPSLNAFTDVATKTHISPLLEQTVTAEIPIFDRVPVLRDIAILEDAKLSIGWTGLFIGEVADPNKSINYTSSPTTGKFLSYRPYHTNFIQNTFNFGVNWNY